MPRFHIVEEHCIVERRYYWVEAPDEDVVYELDRDEYLANHLHTDHQKRLRDHHGREPREDQLTQFRGRLATGGLAFAATPGTLDPHGPVRPCLRLRL